MLNSLPFSQPEISELKDNLSDDDQGDGEDPLELSRT